MLYRVSTSGSQPRRGIVLVAVLVVVSVLALAAYQYSLMMEAEYKGADSNTRNAQTKGAAYSGIAYVMAILSDTDYFTGTLNSNPYDNASYFQNIMVAQGEGKRGNLRFSVITLLSPDDPQQSSQPYRFGVTDEASKLNVNALLQYDKTGTVGLAMLSATSGLPNMTPDIANSLLDWMDPTSSTPRSGGAKDEYYTTLQKPYHVKNGPFDSMDEMLYVKELTTDLLYGNDTNRNGVMDPGETGGNGNGSVDLGWLPYLTIYSREANLTFAGQPRIYINDPSINNLATNLSSVSGMSGNLTMFIVACRLYGVTAPAAAAPGAAPAKAPAALSSNDMTAVQQAITTALTNAASASKPPALQSIQTLSSLINGTVSVTIGSGRTQKTVTLPSPLAGTAGQTTLLPLLLDNCTTSQSPDLKPRINVNTASPTVLSMLTGLSSTDVQAIVANQPSYEADGAPDSSYNTTAWLVTKASLTPAKMQLIEKYITARSTVFRFQVLGYFEGGGPVTRLEAVVDTNYGRPRLVYLRDLTEMGKAFDMSQIKGSGN